MSGKTMEEIRVADLITAIESDDWKRTKEVLSQALAGEPGPEVIELKLRDEEGKKRLVEVSPSFYKERGEVVGGRR